MKRTTAVTAMIAAAALMLAGCSKDSTGTASAGSSGAAVASSPNDAASAAPRAPSSGPKQTVGGGAKGDAATTTWLSTYCEGIAPLTDMSSAMPSMDPSAGAAGMAKSMSDFAKKFGDVFTNTGNKLKALPPPTFSGGDKFAATTVDTLTKAGKALDDSAAKLATASPADMETVAADLEKNLGDASKTIGSIAASPDLAKVIGQVPACAKLAGNG